METKKTEIDVFSELETKYESAIKNHKKMGINTHLFLCENGMSCILREPTMVVSAKVLPYMSNMMDIEPDICKAGSILVDECWVAGDAEIKSNNDLKIEVALAAMKTLQLKVAQTKKN